MKAISVMQPWAALIANRKKRFETRSRPTSYRGEILIHASAGMNKIAKGIASEPLFQDALAGCEVRFGELIAVANLAECFPTEIVFDQAIDGGEYYFGDFSDGRYAYLLEDVRLIKPIKALGQLGIWNWNGTVETV